MIGGEFARVGRFNEFVESIKMTFLILVSNPFISSVLLFFFFAIVGAVVFVILFLVVILIDNLLDKFRKK